MISRHDPLISIIVIAFNEERYIPFTLQSVLDQTYRNIELIVVNNASTDNTAKIASKYTKKVVYEKHKGMSYARNRGISESKGNIIIKLDADTILEKDMVERVVDRFEREVSLAGLSGLCIYNEGGFLLKKISYCYYIVAILAMRLFMGHDTLNGPFYALRSEFAKKVKTHNDDRLYHEDMDLSCHMAVYGKCVLDYSFVNKTSYRHFKDDPLHIFQYIMKSVRTYFKHHPSHKLHKVS